MSGIEDDDFVLAGIVVILVEGKQLIDTEVWVHVANSMHKDVRAAIVVFDIDVVDDTLMQKLHELRTVGIAC